MRGTRGWGKKKSAAILAAMLTLGHAPQSEAHGGASHSPQGKENKPKEVTCKNWHHGHCHRAQNRLRGARHTREGHRHAHGDRASGWRRSSGSFCGGQRGCNSGTGSGYRGLASGLASAASDLTGQVQKLREAQRDIAQTSITEDPGPNSEDARNFNAANENGQSRLSRYADQASDPVVKEQAEAYDVLGEEIGEIEDEASKYQQQADEMNQLAEKAERNTDKLDTQNAPVTGAADRFGAGGTERPNGHIASDPSARLEKNPDGTGKSESQITQDEMGKLSAPPLASHGGPNASYPTASEKSSGHRFTPHGGIREELRARLREKYGREPSAEEVGRVAEAAERAGGLAELEKAGFVDKDGKPLVAPAVGSMDETVASFNKGLGDPNLEIAASETEASVRAMLRSLTVAEDRHPASLRGSGIGGEDGPTLFERARATHVRCQRNGCVGRAGG